MQKKVIFFLSAVPPWHLRPLLSSGHISPAVLFYSSPVPASSPPPPPHLLETGTCLLEAITCH